jgi:chitinase
LLNWNQVYDEDQMVPYAYNDDQWVGFDNTQSIVKKVEIVKQLNLGGVMVIINIFQ